MTLFTRHIKALDLLIGHGLEKGYDVAGLIDRRDVVEIVRNAYGQWLAANTVDATDTL